MSEPSWVYGCIIYTGAPQNTPAICELNRDAIEQLPEKTDRYSLLTRNIFTVPMPDTDAFYRYQMIHFAASYNHLDWDKWLVRFEGLLKTMYWNEANVHVKLFGIGEQNLHWKADIEPLHMNPPQTIQKWEVKHW